ncbi:MAG: glycosyltransferase family 39 protein, partial [Actinomycetota bacterium]|nr:glycosyltransferase family 39 protein [Actinomycetota bacterium]
MAHRTVLAEPAAEPAADHGGPRRPRHARAVGAAIWLLPPLVMAALGAWAVSRDYGLWYDELYTAELARLPLGDLFSAVLHGDGPIPYLRDAPPSYNGPYYAVVHLWLAVTGLQPDEWGLRLLSLLAAVGAVAAFAAAVRRLAGPAVALAAGIVIATNPFVLQFSAEARGYTLALLGVALAALGLARWLDGRRRALLLYGAGAAAAGLAHWFALLVIGAFALAAVALRRRRGVPLLVVSAVAALPALALVGTAMANGVGASGVEWLRGVGGDVPRLVLRSWAGRNAVLLVLTVLLGAAGLILGGRDRKEARLVGAAWFAVPVAAVTGLE